MTKLPFDATRPKKGKKAAWGEAAFFCELRYLQLRHEPPVGVRIVIRKTSLVHR